MLWEGEVDENCDFPFLDWYSYKETCDSPPPPRNIDHLLRRLIKKKLHFYLRCISDMFNLLNQNLFFITHLILQKNLTIV